MLTIWLKPQRGGEGIRETPRDFVVKNLKFTDGQTKQYDLLVKEHQQAMRHMRQEAMVLRRQLFANLKKQAGGDMHYADSLAQGIAGIQKQIETVTYAHFAQVRELCTDTQKVVFDRIITDVVNKMNGPGPGGPPHPYGGVPPPPPDAQGPPPGDEGNNAPPPGGS